MTSGALLRRWRLLGYFVLTFVWSWACLLAWLADHTGGGVRAALWFHTAIKVWPAVVPVLPSGPGWRPYALVVAILVLRALWLLALHRVAGARNCNLS